MRYLFHSRLYILLLLSFIPAVIFAGSGSVYVKGHFTKNGTYIAPHYRSVPDHSVTNNWGIKGNYNAVTGKPGNAAPPPPPGGLHVNSVNGYSRHNGKYVNSYYRPKAGSSKKNTRGRIGHKRSSTKTITEPRLSRVISGTRSSSAGIPVRSPRMTKPAIPASVIPSTAVGARYIGNIQSHKFHRTTCSSVPSPANQVSFGSREAAIQAGYVACKRCKP